MKRLTVLLATSLAMIASAASGQGFPDRPLTMVVPYAAGAQTDILARQVAPTMSKKLGQEIVIDNRGGGSAIPGTQFVSKATADGYTLLFGSLQTHAINAGLYSNLPYDPVEGFVPIARTDTLPLFFAVNSDLHVDSIADLVALAKAKPGELSYASSGIGSSAHILGEMLKQQAGIDIVHVPYNQTTQAFTDVMTGAVAMIVYTYLPLQPVLESGKVKIIAIASEKPSALYPEAPTMASLGYTGFEISPWHGIYAPRGTPPAIVEKLTAAAHAALQEQEVIDSFARGGAEPYFANSNDFLSFTADQVAVYRQLVKASGAKIE